MKIPSVVNFKFLPDSELLNFAKKFSYYYKEVDAGDYYSKRRNYHIRYIEKFRNADIYARVSKTTGIIEIDKTVFKSKEYTPDFMFFLILWCVGSKKYDNLNLTDKHLIEYYLTTGRSKENLKKGYKKLFNEVPTNFNVKSFNAKRYEYILQFLKDDNN